MKKRRILVPAAALIAAAATVWLSSAPAEAGRAATNEQVASQLGVRALLALPSNLSPGAVVQLEVLDAAKLAKFGIAGARRGTRLKLVVVEPGKRFRLEMGTQKRLLGLDERGVLSALP